MQMAFRVDDMPDPQAWFFERLNFRITLPDFRTRGFTLLGGRECSIGPHKAAYLFYDANGETVSLFILPAGKFQLTLQDKRRYRIESARHQMDLWKADGIICILVQNRLAVVSPTV
jgi:anti-sigma factor RsiW